MIKGELTCPNETILAMAEKYPCTACGAKLEFTSKYLNINFKCSQCGQGCIRMIDEDYRQKIITIQNSEI